MKISIIAAVAENNVIGNNNSLIWHLPADLRFFKSKTTGHFIIMGRNTFESIGGGRPLPNRTTIIISRNPEYKIPEGCILVNSLEQAVEICKGEEEIFICGGAQIYEMALPIATDMYITKIHQNFEGDTLFPPIPSHSWQLISSYFNEKDDKNAWNFSFEYWVKRM